MTAELTEITDHSVFSHPNEIMVELRGYTAEGEFTAITYQFEPTGDEESQVRARGSIERAHEGTVRDVLTDAGYTLA